MSMNALKAFMVVIVTPRATTRKVPTTATAIQDFMETAKTAVKVTTIYHCWFMWLKPQELFLSLSTSFFFRYRRM